MRPAAPSVPVVDPPPGAVAAPSGPVLVRERSRWVAVDWPSLPGWADDRLDEAWPALRASCMRPASGWAQWCAEALLNPPASPEAVRGWLMDRLQPYRVESLDGAADGLATGYYEPLIDASRLPTATHRVALHQPPGEPGQARPTWTRRQFDTVPEAQAALRGREIAWLADPLDALVLQIQGSGRLRVTEPDGRVRTVRVAFAGHNDQPYRSVGRWLIEQGELRAGDASWPAIKNWAQRNPQRVDEMLWQNPRVVFFREEPLPDPSVGPRGAMGVPLMPGRSVAVDPLSVPYGTPLWLDTTEPLGAAPLRRLVAAQDTGSAIVGAVRIDYFWGWGDAAGEQAGRMRQAVRVWALWPR